MSFQTFLPVAPFYGIAFTGGAINGPGVIQLYNPVGSGVTGVLYEITISTPSGILTSVSGPGSIRMRRASVGTMSPGGGFTEGFYQTLRPDPSYTSSSSMSFRSYNFTVNGELFLDNQAQWFGLPGQEGQDAWQPTILRQGFNTFPLFIRPGSALELQANSQGVGNQIKSTLLWTEEP